MGEVKQLPEGEKDEAKESLERWLEEHLFVLGHGCLLSLMLTEFAKENPELWRSVEEKLTQTSIEKEVEICKKLNAAWEKGATHQELVALYRQLRNPEPKPVVTIRRITGHEPDIEWG